MRKRIVIWALVAILLLTVGCSPASPAQPTTADAAAERPAAAPAEAATEGKTYKIAYVTRTLSDSFSAFVAENFKKECANYPDMTIDVFDGQDDSERQNAMIENCITQGYDCIIVTPNDSESQRPYCESVVAAGIKLITTSAAILDLEGGSTVDADPYEQAKVCAEAAVKLAPQGARVLELYCLPGNYHTTHNAEAWKAEFLAKRSDCVSAGEVWLESSNEALAMKTMEDYMQAGHIDVVIGCSDVTGLGALEACKDDPAYSDLLVFGIDGILPAMISIKNGVMTGTCLQSAIELAKSNIAAAHALVTGEEEQVNAKIDSPYIDASNVDKYFPIYINSGDITVEKLAEQINMTVDDVNAMLE